ncbi:MAG: leucine-rich repeat domain-containing protein, partial [Clostridiales bacterium]|nr:leucine-rich repeat domain-containing protein [Clostridiales bacterium]
TIGHNVTTIPNYAFSGCRSVASIEIPNSVTSIGEGAFDGCISLKTVCWNATACASNHPIFNNCNMLTTITIGHNVTTIPNYAFSGCRSVASIEIPNSVTSIGEGAFDGCSGLTIVTIGNGVASIQSYAFSGCSSLTSVSIPSSINYVSESAFVGCIKLQYNEYSNAFYLGNNIDRYVVLIKVKSTDITSCTIHSATKVIFYDAFIGCTKLSGTVIDSIEYLGNSYNSKWVLVNANRNMISYSIDDSQIILQNAFSDCNKLESITVNSNHPYYCSQNGILYNKAKTEIIHVPQAISGAVSIPNGVTSIGDSAFSECRRLTSITIPNSVTSIGDRAFEFCTSLTSVELSECVTSIGSYAFRVCSSLLSIVISNSVTSIGSWAFGSCSKLIIYCEATKQPSGWYSDMTFGWNYPKRPVIWDCKNNNKDVNGYEYAIVDGIRYSLKADIATVIEQPGNLSGAITIPSNVTYKSATYSVTSIGKEAFHGCGSLMSITIPSSVTSIVEGAFYGCSALTLYCEVASKPSGWDSNWSNYGQVGNIWNYSCPVIWNYKNNNKDVDGYEYAIIGGIRYSLKDGTAIVIEQPSNISGVITIPSNVTYKSATYNVTNIGKEAFLNCSSLTRVAIPNSITSIGSFAFDGCSGLNSIEMSSSVKSFGQQVFYGCSGLTSITFNGTKAQWRAISKGSHWKDATGEYIVTCTDGTLGKSES